MSNSITFESLLFFPMLWVQLRRPAQPRGFSEETLHMSERLAATLYHCLCTAGRLDGW